MRSLGSHSSLVFWKCLHFIAKTLRLEECFQLPMPVPLTDQSSISLLSFLVKDGRFSGTGKGEKEDY